MRQKRPPGLTFQHWSGVTPYTSSCELAGSCVFGKQSLGVFSCGPAIAGRVILRTYDRCIAEFLNEESLVHLRLLASPTCVGFRYGHCQFSSRGFSWQRAQRSCSRRNFRQISEYCDTDFPVSPPRLTDGKSNNALHLQRCVAPSKIDSGAGILTGCPSESPLGLSLGPTNPWLINIAKETLGLRCAGLSPALWLLIPTFSLPNAPLRLAS